MPYNKNSGFSLVETLAIITILAIIASISVPYFHIFFAKQEAIQTIRTLNGFLKSAKNEASVRHARIVICSSSNYEQCENNNWNNKIIAFLDSNANRKIDHHDVVLKTESLQLKYGQLSWKAALNSPNIIFNQELGLPIGYNGSFYYCNHTHAIYHKIILSKMGHVRTETLDNC